MSNDEWMRAFKDAWREFYAPAHMERALLRQNPHTYWGLFKVFLWYRVAMIEDAHPMITGFVRLRSRTTRRPGFPIEHWLTFRARRLAETASLWLGYMRVAFEMHDLWMRTRIRRRDYVRWQPLRGFVTRAATPSHVKLEWTRLHADLAERGHALSEFGKHSTAQLSATMRARLTALRDAVSGPNSEPPTPVATRARRWRLVQQSRTWLPFLRALVSERY
jgi:hypothetical protein